MGKGDGAPGKGQFLCSLDTSLNRCFPMGQDRGS